MTESFPRRAGEPGAEPLTAEEAILHLREVSDGGPNDAYIGALITVARIACEDRTERTLVAAPWRLTLDAFPNAIKLYRPPVIAVQSIEFTDADGVNQTLDPADYVVDAESEPGWVVPAVGKKWPITKEEIGAVRVFYTAGYGADPASVPAPLRQWMLLAIGDMYEYRKASSERPSVPQQFADRLLDPYRIWSI
ncbi:MAG: head-tail connector protein [Hydrogenophaga sp.]|uniref:head-tail connector protein n=1 Tax=Hydrogenophaga sp. TaxID=1904254 RepID=UPI0040373731